MVKVSIIGAGAWGTTLSLLFAEKGQEVCLWAFEKDLVPEMIEFRENKTFLPGFQLPENIEITSDYKTCLDSQIIIFAVPAQFLRSIAKQTRTFINPNAVIVSASKGIEDETLALPLDILKQELKAHKFAALSGPNLSREIAEGLPAATVAASEDLETARFIQDHLMLERFRVYTSSDPLGVQLGGALKNVVAIAAGVADGLELGNNAKAGLMIRGIAEITRLGLALGAKAETFTGLSGMGDLITTCESRLSRNHLVGEQLAKGKKLKDILAHMKEVAEGVSTSKAALALGKKHKVDLPIILEVYKILYQGKNPYQAITDLMSRTAKNE